MAERMPKRRFIRGGTDDRACLAKRRRRAYRAAADHPLFDGRIKRVHVDMDDCAGSSRNQFILVRGESAAISMRAGLRSRAFSTHNGLFGVHQGWRDIHCAPDRALALGCARATGRFARRPFAYTTSHPSVWWTRGQIALNAVRHF